MKIETCQVPESGRDFASSARRTFGSLVWLNVTADREKRILPLCLLLVYLWLTYLITCLFMPTLTILLLLLSSGDLLLFVSRYLLIVKRNTRCKCPEWTPVKCWTTLFRCHDTSPHSLTEAPCQSTKGLHYLVLPSSFKKANSDIIT